MAKALWKKALIGIVLFILLGAAILFTRKLQEGFENTKLNVEYIPEEVFLVAPVLNPTGIFEPTDATYADGYTYDEAVAKCQSYGGRLATSTELNVALDLSGHWCSRGWTEGDRTKAYSLNPFPGACPGKTTRQVVEVTVPGTGVGAGKAFAICMAKKPPFLATNDVQDFSKDSYSMFSDDFLQKVMSGSGKPDTAAGVTAATRNNDMMYPKQFTRSQALWALTNPTVAADKYKPLPARALLLQKGTADEERPTINDAQEYNLQIARNVQSETVEPSTDRTAWNTNARNKTCEMLTSVVNDVNAKLTTIQNYFRDISGMVVTALDMKKENGYLQSVVADVCRRNEKTEACTRLMSLDFDVFYKNRTPNALTQKYIIDDLEGLNLALQMRECELQQILGGIQQVNDIIGAGCTFNLFEGKRYNTGKIPKLNERGEPMMGANGQPVFQPITCKNIQQTIDGKEVDVSKLYEEQKDSQGNPMNPNYKPFRVGNDVNLNGVDKLKKSLEQISPYYSTEQFNSLTSIILDRLNEILEPPDGTKFYPFNDIFKRAGTNMSIVKNLLGITS